MQALFDAQHVRKFFEQNSRVGTEYGEYIMNGHFQEFEDEYLEMMYEFHEKQPSQPVRNGDLASALGVSPASATEMVQRLAGKGMLDYVPYKGATLTDKGMVHGQKMKRRHRLAEVFLAKLSFQGDIHATACRLEHAFDDDLEVAMSLLLGQPEFDPSGRDIPLATPDISKRIQSTQSQVRSLDSIEVGASGQIEALFLSASDSTVFSRQGVSIGAEISRTADGYSFSGNPAAQISTDFASRILVRVSRE